MGVDLPHGAEEAPRPAYRAMLGRILEAALLVVGALWLAVGAAAVPAGILGVAGNPSLVTGDPLGEAPAPARCEQLLHMVSAPTCAQALVTHHLEEVVRNHLLVGVVGFVVLVAWWLVHLRRRSQPSVLPIGFDLTMCGSWLLAASIVLLTTGGYELAMHHDSTAGVAGSGDVVVTGATVLLTASACWGGLARQLTRHPD